MSRKKIDAAYGYDRSLRERSCVDKDGNAVPWMTYPAIEYLSQFDFSENTLFEWGGWQLIELVLEKICVGCIRRLRFCLVREMLGKP